MLPFVNYYGGKFRLAPDYGRQQRPHVIEPFAGFAGYSTYWEPAQVTLVEKDARLIAIWKYLQRASPQEIMRLPIDIETVDGLRICEEAKWLIGFWFDRGLSKPRRRRSALSYWDQKVRARIARQVEKIRHWQIIEGDYSTAPDIEAHWHIDPPYQGAGKHYAVNGIDRAQLADWCKQRRGYVQVCESPEADWLPFEPFAIVTAGACHGNRKRGFSAEAIFEFERNPLA
jgi:site-specific DNA-adenine methylase